ncbi:MAG: M48 family metalloprotease [Pseudomonadota bacterium]|nr:M48 family metalloprotease [Pseudomonadota bacterium]
MNKLVYPNETILGWLTLILGSAVWIFLAAGLVNALPSAALVGILGSLLVALLVGFLFYLMAQSALISHIRGSGVELSPEQLPDLHAKVQFCMERLQLKKAPRVYVLNGDGGMNAFATKFLGVPYVVLLSSVVDAMKEHPDGVNFYIGHEMGHLRMRHLSWQFLRWPVLWLPLLGAAYSRARESTCDRHGLACCASPQNAAYALVALASGAERWKDTSLQAFVGQTRYTKGFWMSLHELVGAYPWLTKRVARVMNLEQPEIPRRNIFSYLLAILIPYSGRLGVWGILIWVYLIGVLVAVALPAYQDYTVRAKLTAVDALVQPVTAALGQAYQKDEAIPESLQEVNAESTLASGESLEYDSDTMTVTVHTSQGPLLYTPKLDSDGSVVWSCAGVEGADGKADIRPNQLPAACKEKE